MAGGCVCEVSCPRLQITSLWAGLIISLHCIFKLKNREARSAHCAANFFLSSISPPPPTVVLRAETMKTLIH